MNADTPSWPPRRSGYFGEENRELYVAKESGRLHVFAGRNRHLIRPEFCSRRSAAGKFSESKCPDKSAHCARIGTAAATHVASWPADTKQAFAASGTATSTDKLNQWSNAWSCESNTHIDT
jgi:hypothetical protein